MVATATLIEKRFRLERCLGRGGAGEVHEAHDLLNDRRVALKLLALRNHELQAVEQASDKELEEQLRAEFRVLRSLSHPGIVQVYEYGHTDDGTPFYTMELFSEGDLSQAKQTDPDALVRDVTQALDFLHAHDLVHSDLKPSNIFLKGETFKLTDFGLVRRTRDVETRGPYGTLAYMPPERLRGRSRNPDPREDLYALGAILLEVLSGRPPYVRDDPEKTTEAILEADLESELQRAPSPWRGLLARLLAPEPAARPASAWEFLQLWSATRGQPEPPLPTWEHAFVGRRRELAQLRDAVGRVTRGKSGAVYICGRPGLGKSALLENTRSQVAAMGLPQFHVEIRSAPRALTLVEQLVRFYDRWQPDTPDTLAAIEHLRAWPQRLRGVTDDVEELNVHVAAMGCIRTLARDTPHVLLIDDVHRLDSGSARFLALMLMDLGQTSPFLFLSGRLDRTGNWDLPEGLAGAIQQAEADGYARVLNLHELSAEEVTTLVRKRFGDAPEFTTLASRIWELTQGHPFFVTEALRRLVLTHQMRRDRDGWQLVGQSSEGLLPQVAETILVEHVAAVPEAAHALYEVLALLPEGADAARLARITEEPGPEVTLKLKQGVHVGLLSMDSDTLHFRFQHELIREACASRCPQEKARSIHQRIADESIGTTQEAYHRLHAGEKSPTSRKCFLRAGAAYSERRSHGEALRYFEAALDIEANEAETQSLALQVAELRLWIGKFEEAAGLIDDQLAAVTGDLPRARLLHCLGRTRTRQGRNEEAVQHLQAAVHLAGRAGAAADDQYTFATDLATALIAKGDHDAAIEVCRATYESVAAAVSPTAQSRLILSQAQAERQKGDYAVAEATCRRALKILKPHGRTLELGRTYNQIGINYHFRADFEQAIRFQEAAAKVHAELGDLNGLKHVYGNLGNAQMRAGQLQDAIYSFEKSLDLKRQLGDRVGEGITFNNLGNLWDMRGEHLRSINSYRHGIAVFRKLNRPREIATLYNNVSEVHRRLGRFPSALKFLRRAQKHSRNLQGAYITQVIRFNLAETLRYLGEPKEAAALLQQALPAVRQSGLPGLVAQYEAALALVDPVSPDSGKPQKHVESAQAHLERLEGDSEDRLTVLLLLAQWAEARQDVPRLWDWAQEAAEVAQEAKRPHGRVQALRLAAGAALGKGDWDVAEALLNEAIETAISLGFRHELARCYKLLAKLHWEIGLRSEADQEFDRCLALLEELGLKTELGLTYLEVARLTSKP